MTFGDRKRELSRPLSCLSSCLGTFTQEVRKVNNMFYCTKRASPQLAALFWKLLVSVPEHWAQ